MLELATAYILPLKIYWIRCQNRQPISCIRFEATCFIFGIDNRAADFDLEPYLDSLSEQTIA